MREEEDKEKDEANPKNLKPHGYSISWNRLIRFPQTCDVFCDFHEVYVQLELGRK